MNEDTLKEATDWALETFPQPRNVGEKAEYQGALKFSSGSMMYRRMSYEVASFGKTAEIDLLRPSSKALTQVLHPLPPGISLARSQYEAEQVKERLTGRSFQQLKEFERKLAAMNVNGFASQPTTSRAG